MTKVTKITFLELAEAVLKEAKMPLNYMEMWDSAKAMGIDKKLGSESKTPSYKKMLVLIYDNIRKGNSKFYITSKRPTRFWLKSRENELDTKKINSEIQNAESKIKKQSDLFHERDLHPLLAKFLYEDEIFGLQTRTIYHEKSSKKEQGQNKWNHPDIVGVKFPFDKEPETLNLLSNINQSEYKLYSFELKKSINFSNLKEYYFQTVSNSSWANEGYLVVFEYIDKEVLNELKRLNASFGIGIIQLKINILDSEVILPATQRNLDIETLNMLVEENHNFKEFIKDINEHIRAKQAKLDYTKDKFDKILSDNELDRHIKNKNITKYD